MSILNRRPLGPTYYSPSQSHHGYTLFSPMKGSGAFLADMEGRFVHYWRLDLYPACQAKLLPNGNLLYAGALPQPPLPEFGGIGGKLIELDWDGNVVWEYEDRYMHHDFCRLPNGNTMILRWVETPAGIAAKAKGGLPRTEREGVVWADAFREISPEGKVVWEWLGYQHLNTDEDVMCPLCNRAEWTHANTCNVLPNGDILTSFMRLNTIAIIDKNSGQFNWKWGQGILGHQHDPSFLENGHVMVFDNGTHRPDTPEKHYGINWSRVLEIDPKTGEVVWEYADPTILEFNGCFLSGAQRLPNGNTLISEGTKGRFFEVTPDRTLVWEYVNPFYFEKYYIIGRSNAVFKAWRYPPDYPAFQGKDLGPYQYEIVLEPKTTSKQEVDGEARKQEPESSVQDRLQKLGY